jgi:exopolyphosphatase/guanosine-5'-triphosphate,3'-diphosphate pyrophosphatase
MKVAGLDLGSNTFLMLIAEVENGRIKKVYRDELEVTRLGQGVHENKIFHPEALQRAETCFARYQKILELEKPESIVAFATSAARDVKNGHMLFDLGKKYQIPVEIIPGDQEAEITFRGSTFEYDDQQPLCVVDVGGGSTEVIARNRDGVICGASVNVGAVRLTEMFVKNHPVDWDVVMSVRKYCRQKLSEVESELPERKKWATQGGELVAVAGTPTTLAAVINGRPFDDEFVHRKVIHKDEMEQWLLKLSKMDLETRKNLIGMDPKRADVMIAGISILLEAMEFLGASRLTVSTKGVRYGVVMVAEARARA